MKQFKIQVNLELLIDIYLYVKFTIEFGTLDEVEVSDGDDEFNRSCHFVGHIGEVNFFTNTISSNRNQERCNLDYLLKQ